MKILHKTGKIYLKSLGNRCKGSLKHLVACAPVYLHCRHGLLHLRNKTTRIFTDKFLKRFRYCFIYVYVFACISGRIPHVSRCLKRPEEGVRAPGTGVTGNCEPAQCVPWEMNPCPQQEKPQPSLQDLKKLNM